MNNNLKGRKSQAKAKTKDTVYKEFKKHTNTHFWYTDAVNKVQSCHQLCFIPSAVTLSFLTTSWSRSSFNHFNIFIHASLTLILTDRIKDGFEKQVILQSGKRSN